jgi:hypothetical protein
MLKITEGRLSDESATLCLEGQVIGPWVDEVRQACEPWLCPGRELTLDLAEVSFADRDGIALFGELRGRRVAFVNCSPFLTEQLKAAAV